MQLPSRPRELADSLNREKPRKLYNTVTILGHLVRVVSPDSEWQSHLVKLLKAYPMANPAAMGFPANWRDLPVWSVVPPGEPRPRR